MLNKKPEKTGYSLSQGQGLRLSDHVAEPLRLMV